MPSSANAGREEGAAKTFGRRVFCVKAFRIGSRKVTHPEAAAGVQEAAMNLCGRQVAARTSSRGAEGLGHWSGLRPRSC